MRPHTKFRANSFLEIRENFRINSEIRCHGAHPVREALSRQMLTQC